MSGHNVRSDREWRGRGAGPGPGLGAALAGAGVAEQVVVALLVVGLDGAELLESCATVGAGDEICSSSPTTTVLVVINHA